MKKNCILFACMLLVLGSCSKHKNGPIPDDLRCISRSVPDWHNSTLSPTDDSVVVNLFRQNGLSTDNLLFIGPLRYDTLISSGVANRYVHITAEQFLNGLPVLNPVHGFHFDNGSIEFYDSIKITSTTLDTIPSLQLTQVRKLYTDQLQRDQNTTFRSFADSCLTATFGYYDLNSGTGNQAVNLAKAWQVHPTGHDAPVAYFKEDGTLIFYFNGILLL